MATPKMMHATEATNLADILERVLDKGIVIAGDISEIERENAALKMRLDEWSRGHDEKRKIKAK